MNKTIYYQTGLGKIVHGNSLKTMEKYVEPKSLDLIITSPPFGLVRKKDYGNVDAKDYLEWFKPFGRMFKRLLKEQGSLVIDIGGSWIPGQPTRSLYHFKLVIMLCEEIGFHLAQEFYWWNPSKLPTPAEWVTVRRIRVKDAVNCIWWLSPSPDPKASNKPVLQPYSDSMRDLLKNGYKAKKRPSGHDISEKFRINHGASIPPNLIALANTESNSYYLKYCAEHGITPHPARFPDGIPEFFIRMLTDPGDFVADPFAGSCVTGEVAERLSRKWLCIEKVEEYLTGALGRFDQKNDAARRNQQKPRDKKPYYKIPRPGLLWEEEHIPPSTEDRDKKEYHKYPQQLSFNFEETD
ncbi:MAG: site-specific DNA-methyltransferase [Candidatus Aminicenantes bacterium]|nr:MAG: site-specific DNA-methyltransferase [Candidatus Aminicenantes bacterium]